jgi:4-hydroxybenzoate polyprenyltransferase
VSLVALARPKGTALLLVVPLTGYGFAHWDYSLGLTRPLALVGVLLAWVLLSAGSLWLNAALDGPESAALFAPRVRAGAPRLVVMSGYAALLLAVIVASVADRRAGACCTTCALLAVVYSHPRTRWKAHPVLGPLVNAVGYGCLSWLAGWSVARVPMSARTAAAMMLLTLFVLGMSFAAQAYQRDDDARRGYRTLVVTRGPAACLAVATACARASIAGVAVLAALGVYPRSVLLGTPVFLLAERTMARWRRAEGGGTPGLAARYMLDMLAGGAVLVALAAFAGCDD